MTLYNMLFTIRYVQYMCFLKKSDIVNFVIEPSKM